MKLKKYLVINENGSCAIKANQPNLQWNEISVLLEINIPSSVFQRPAITAKLTINENQVRPEEITIEMKNEIQDLVLQNLGIELRILDPLVD